MTQQKTYSGFSVGVVSITEDDKPQGMAVSIMDNLSGTATSVSINYTKHLVTQLLMAIDFIETAKASEKKEES